MNGRPSARPTRVVVPMLNFVPGGMGGSETYARAVIQQLASRDELDVTCVVPSNAAGLFGEAREVAEPYHARGESAIARLTGMSRGLRPSQPARETLRNADVIHHPFTVPIPPARGIPRITTLHDVQHHDLPELFPTSERLFRRGAYDAAARGASRVITVSEFCRARIIETLGIDAENIVVAHLGVDPELFAPYDGPRESFVLYPARAWPHKNHSRLFEAMSLVRQTHPDMRLVLTGGDAGAHGAQPPWVEHRGQVDDAELRDLYRRAAALAFPSQYEGFGLPPLEAMASGCPVAVANAGALPEICGDAAVMFDPANPRDIARGILEAVSARSELAPRGHARVLQFSWEACAEVHADVYTSVSRQGTS